MSFNDITGQEVAKQLLISTIKMGHVAGNYLFFGPPGVGKTKTAIEFVKALNCPEFDASGASCDSCDNCKSISMNNNPDFDIIEPAQEKSGQERIQTIKIDQIRDLQNKYSFRPAWLKFRVAIIRKTELFKDEAANAFLKILEEPPSSTLFILVTSNINAVIPTIRSRCQPVRFRKLKNDEIRSILKEKELTDDILALANGSISYARKLLDPEYTDMKEKVNNFISISSMERTKILPDIEKLELQEVLFYSQQIYKKEFYRLSKQTGRKTEENSVETLYLNILDALNTCEKGFKALKRNVNKKSILYWLANTLPVVPTVSGQ